MFDEYNKNREPFYVNAKTVLPLLIVIASFSFVFFNYFTPDTDESRVYEPSVSEYYSDIQDSEFNTEPSEIIEIVDKKIVSSVRGPVSSTVSSEIYDSEKWIIDSNSSTLYVVQETAIYACPDYNCDVITTVFPGVYWNLPYTFAQDGWLETNVSGIEGSGFISVSNVSAQLPGRCRLILPYRVGFIGEQFIDEGFNPARLKAFVLATEKQIEDVIGRNVLNYDDDAINTINFVITYYDDAEPLHRGLHKSTAVFPNGAVGSFWVGVYAALFDDVQTWYHNGYIGAKDIEAFQENYIKKTILHEMIHTLGFGHVDNPTAIMCGEPNCRPAEVDFTNELFLTSVDETEIVSWCE